MRITGNRIFISLLQETDAEDLLDLHIRNREFFQKYSPYNEDDFYTIEFKRNYIKSSIEQSEKGSQYSFGIYLNNNEKLIGDVDLFHIFRGCLQTCLIGYSLDKQFNGNGYATEAVSLAVKFAFEELKLHRIEAGVMLNNIGSMRVLEKAGFHKEGMAQKNVKINGKWEDHQVFAIISNNNL